MQVLDAYVSEVRADASEDALTSLTIEFDQAVLVRGDVPAEVVGAFLRLLSDEDFLANPGSWHLAYMVQASFEFLESCDRSTLRGPIERAFDRFGDETGAMVVGEILAQLYSDEGALAALDRLSRTSRMPARGLVPYGLKELALHTKSAGLRTAAVARLRELENDPDDDVRAEVGAALTRIRAG